MGAYLTNLKLKQNCTDLNETVDGNECAGPADAGAAVDQDGAAAAPRLVDPLHEAQHGGRVLGRVEVLQFIWLDFGSEISLCISDKTNCHHSRKKVMQNINPIQFVFSV